MNRKQVEKVKLILILNGTSNFCSQKASSDRLTADANKKHTTKFSHKLTHMRDFASWGLPL